MSRFKYNLVWYYETRNLEPKTVLRYLIYQAGLNYSDYGLVSN